MYTQTWQWIGMSIDRQHFPTHLGPTLGIFLLTWGPRQNSRFPTTYAHPYFVCQSCFTWILRENKYSKETDFMKLLLPPSSFNINSPLNPTTYKLGETFFLINNHSVLQLSTAFHVYFKNSKFYQLSWELILYFDMLIITSSNFV